MNPLRETINCIAHSSSRGVRITIKRPSHYPKSLVVSSKIWSQLERMSDAEFDGSCVLELGIGAFDRP